MHNIECAVCIGRQDIHTYVYTYILYAQHRVCCVHRAAGRNHTYNAAENIECAVTLIVPASKHVFVGCQKV